MHTRILDLEPEALRLAKEGWTQLDIAKKLGMSPITVRTLARRNHVAFTQGKKSGPLDKERAASMKAMRKEGKTLQEIGDVYGLTRQRVKQIISK